MVFGRTIAETDVVIIAIPKNYTISNSRWLLLPVSSLGYLAF